MLPYGPINLQESPPPRRPQAALPPAGMMHTAPFDPYSPMVPQPSAAPPQGAFGGAVGGPPLRGPAPARAFDATGGVPVRGALPTPRQPDKGKLPPGTGKKVADAIEEKGLDLDAVLADAAKQHGQPPPPVEGLSRSEKGELLMELGVRMMALSGQPGANTASSFGQAALGALGSQRGMKDRKRAEAAAALERREKGIDRDVGYALKREDLRDKREDRKLRREQQSEMRQYRNRPVGQKVSRGVLYNVYPDGSARMVRGDGNVPFRPDQMTADKIVAARQRALQDLSKDMNYMVAEPGQQQVLLDQRMQQILEGTGDDGLEPIGFSQE